MFLKSMKKTQYDRIFITGIGTDVGKTVVSAIICEALEGDYIKPVQAGSLENTDSDTVKALLTNKRSQVHPERFRLKTPCSPHAAAAIDGVSLSCNDITFPELEDRPLIIEGAGGVLVPLNDSELMIDLIVQSEAAVIVVSRNYLGSINHTLLTVEALRRRGIPILGLVFNGADTPATEQYIRNFTGIPWLGRIQEEPSITQEVVYEYARRFKQTLAFVRRTV
jgi:dethiobiotin synthetase